MGPTFVKLGQMLSVRPDVLPKGALEELEQLQTNVECFDTEEAMQVVEKELGAPLGDIFREISQEPIAAGSLAQVYKAKLRSGKVVAVKVQRPGVLEMVSKDLYVLRRASEVFQGLVQRFAPQQNTNYIALLNEWAAGFYTELDFKNEANNQQKLREILQNEGVKDVYIPKVHQDLSTRKVLVSEWIDGRKLSECTEKELRKVIGIGQECFLTQLLQAGVFHADPHPGNLIFMTDRSKGKVALLDFGLVASLEQEDIDRIVSSIVHLANKDYASLVDDFVSLGILPLDCNRSKVIPLMDKALSPYVRGGGAKKYQEEVKRIYGMDTSSTGASRGFQSMTQDVLTVLNDILFSVPPYFSLLGRAILTLEGIALQADPDYSIIMEAYPFVARKLLRDDRPDIQKALQEVLYVGSMDFSADRLSTLLNGALGVLAATEGGVFIDFDKVPEDGVSLKEALKYVLSDNSKSLRKLLKEEATNAGDILLRQAIRKTYDTWIISRPGARLLGARSESIENRPRPLLVSSRDGKPGVIWMSRRELVDIVAPKLDQTEELYALSIVDLTKETFGDDVGLLLNGDGFSEPRASLNVIFRTIFNEDVLKSQGVPNILASFAGLLGSSIQGNNGGQMDADLEGMFEVVSNLDGKERDLLREEGIMLIEDIRKRIQNRFYSVQEKSGTLLTLGD